MKSKNKDQSNKSNEDYNVNFIKAIKRFASKYNKIIEKNNMEENKI